MRNVRVRNRVGVSLLDWYILTIESIFACKFDYALKQKKIFDSCNNFISLSVYIVEAHRYPAVGDRVKVWVMREG